MESDEKDLYSMDELVRVTGISYSTLSSYLRLHGDRIPSEKRGKLRFFPPRAVDIVREIARANQARQGRSVRRKTREKAVSDEALAWLERAARELDKVAKYLDTASFLLLRNSGTVVLSLRRLAPDLVFRHSVDVLLEPAGPDCVARLFEVNLCADGATRQEAMDNLRAVIVETYQELRSTEQEHWTQELRERAALVDMVRKARPKTKASGAASGAGDETLPGALLDFPKRRADKGAGAQGSAGRRPRKVKRTS